MEWTKYIYFYIIFLSFCPLVSKVNPAWSSENSSLRVTGYVKPLFTLTDFKSQGVRFEGNTTRKKPEIESTFTTTFRASVTWKPHNRSNAEIAYELAPQIQNPDLGASFFAVQASDPLSYRAYDFGQQVDVFRKSSDVRIFHNLDRLMITLSPDYADISIGRQPIAFGSARVINPTDILTSFAYTELNKEERIGVDALRVRFPLGVLSEIDTGLVFGDDFSTGRSAAFLRGRFSVSESDLSPIVILFQQNLLLGFDMASSLGDAGVYIESAYVYANITDNHITDQDYFRVSTGLDYSFTENLYAYVEFHYNEAGESSPEDYQKLLLGLENNIAYSEGAVYLLGRHYLAPGFSYQATPLVTLFAQALYNMNDHSVLLFPDFQYSISDDAVLEVGAFIGLGKGNEIIRNIDTGLLRISTNSEFDLYPDTYFVSAKFYF